MTTRAEPRGRRVWFESVAIALGVVISGAALFVSCQSEDASSKANDIAKSANAGTIEQQQFQLASQVTAVLRRRNLSITNAGDVPIHFLALRTAKGPPWQYPVGTSRLEKCTTLSIVFPDDVPQHMVVEFVDIDDSRWSLSVDTGSIRKVADHVLAAPVITASPPRLSSAALVDGCA